MPRITIPRGMLGGMQPGMSRLASALAGGDQAYEQGYQGGAAAQSKIAQALAQVEAARSQQRLHDAQADEVTRKTRLLEGRPDLAEEQIAFSTGLDVPTVRGYRQAITTGRAPQVPMGPETEDGQTGLGTMPIDPAVRTKIGQALARVVPLLTNSGDLNPEQLAQAAGAYRQQDLADAIIAGTADRNKVGGAQAAVAGKPLFHADGSGAVLDQFGGGLDTSNPLAQSTIGLRGAQAGQARAAAAENYAQADTANARTKLLQQQGAAPSGADGSGASGIKAPMGYRWKADGSGLEPIPGGPADKRNSPTIPGEVRRMNIAMRALDEGLNEYERLLADVNPRNPAAAFDPTKRARAESLQADLRMQLKEAQALGALTGPDMEILDKALSDPMTLRGAIFGRSGLTEQLKNTRAGLQRRRNAIEAEFGIPSGGAAPAQPGAPDLAAAAAAELARRRQQGGQ